MATIEKAALASLTLAATWATAEADTYHITVSPTTTIDNASLYHQRLDEAGFFSSASGPNGSPDLTTIGSGEIVSGSNYTFDYVTSPGSSSGAPNGPFGPGYEAINDGFSIAGTFNGGTGVIVGGYGSNGTGSFATDVTSNYSFNDYLSGVQASNISIVGDPFFSSASHTSAWPVQANVEDGGTLTANLYAYSDGSTAPTTIGSFSVTPQAVPEPAPFLGLGLGGLILLRRRRR